MKIHSELKPKKISFKVVKHSDQIDNLLYGNVINARIQKEFGDNFMSSDNQYDFDNWYYLKNIFSKRIKNL